MKKLILSTVSVGIFLFSAGNIASAEEVLPLELLRMTSFGHEPLAYTKSTSISVFRLPIASRYLIRSEPVSRNMESFVPSYFYECVDTQLQELKKALVSSTVKKPPRNVTIIVTEAFGEAGSNVCNSMGEFLSESALVMQTCLDVHKGSTNTCRPMDSKRIIENYAQRDVTSEKKKQSHTKMLKSADELLNLLSK